MADKNTQWEIVELPPVKARASAGWKVIEPEAATFTDANGGAWKIIEPEQNARPNFFDQFDEPAKPAANFFDQFDDADRAAVSASAPAAAEEVPDRGLIEGIVSDARHMLGLEQTDREKAQRARSYAKLEEERGAGGWKDTLFSKDGARLVAQGASLGSADEIEAAVRSLGSETYDEALESIRNDLAAAREKPGSLLIEMGSGALVPGGAAVNSLRAAPSIWRAAKYGAGMGGAAGYLGAEGASDPDATMLDHVAERLPKAAFSAALGGTMGAALPAAGIVARGVGGIAKARLGVGNEQFARKALADALQDARPDPLEIALQQLVNEPIESAQAPPRVHRSRSACAGARDRAGQGGAASQARCAAAC